VRASNVVQVIVNFALFVFNTHEPIKNIPEVPPRPQNTVCSENILFLKTDLEEMNVFTCDHIPRDPRNPLLSTLSGTPKFQIAECTYGRGLVAVEDIPAHEVIAVYPMDYIIGTTTFYYAWTRYNQRMSDGYAIEFQSPYFEATVRGMPSTAPHAAFAHAHLLNDVKQTEGVPTRREYEQDTKTHANVAFVDCNDMIVAETLRPVSKGEEFLVAYGYTYWAPPIEEIALRAIAEAVYTVVCIELEKRENGSSGSHLPGAPRM